MKNSNIAGLKTFCSNIIYYDDNDEYNSGYKNAIEDILCYLEQNIEQTKEQETFDSTKAREDLERDYQDWIDHDKDRSDTYE